MNKTTLFIIPLAMMALLAGPALAQTQYRFEVFGAADIPSDNDFEITVPQSPVPIMGTHQFSPGVRGGVRLGADGQGHWGQDLIYSYGTNESKIVNHDTGASFAFTNRIHQFSYNALLYPGGADPQKRFLPYLTAGVGGTIFTLSQTAKNEALDPNRQGLGEMSNRSLLAFNAGAGAVIKLDSRYGVGLDARDTKSQPSRSGLPKASDDPAVTVFPVHGLFHQFQASVAFVCYF
jgi:opacity protein-like surface antigen